MDIINRCPFTNDHLIDARLASTESIFKQQTLPEEQTVHNNEDDSTSNHIQNLTKRSFPVLMKLVSTSLIGPTIYKNVYKNIADNEDMNKETKTSKGVAIPTLAGIARKIARLEGTQLDKKQYVAYEVI